MRRNKHMANTALINAIEVKNLTKSYKNFSMNKISFSVPMGSIMGFVGENGAGKTTTIKAILNLLHPDGGEISVLGESSKWRSRRRRAGST
jgi:ABC-2 type transport system ATP-binding protein